MSRFITLDGEHGFWVRNSFFDLWLAVLALHIKPTAQNDSTSSRLAHRWQFAARNGLADTSMPTEELFPSQGEGLQIARDAVSSLRHTLERLPEPFHTDALALFGVDGGWDVGPMSKRYWVGLTAAFADLLDGKVSAKADSKMNVVEELAAYFADASDRSH